MNQQNYSNHDMIGNKPKSKLAAGLLAILLGLGIYNFYLGYVGKAIIQLVISFVAICVYIYDIVTYAIAISQWSGFGPMPEFWSQAFIIGGLLSLGVGIWQFIEGILIFTGVIDRDGKGNPIV